MTKLHDLAKHTVHLTLKQGAQQAGASIQRTRYIQVVQRDGKLERVRESLSSSLSLSVYAGGRYSQHSTSDLRPTALEQFVGRAIEMTKVLAPDEHRHLLDPKYYEGRRTEPLDIRDPAYDRIDTKQRTDLAVAVERGAKQAKGPIISVRAEYRDEKSDWVRVHSNGFEDSDASTAFWIGAMATVDDDGRKPEDYHFIGGRYLADMQDPEAVGLQASRRALARMGQTTLPSGAMTVVVENRTVARVLGYLLSALQGSSLQQKRSFLLEKKGQKIGGATFTLIDDPFLPRGMGSARFDSDGMSKRKRVLVDEGTLQDYLIDNYYARKMAVEPTGYSTSNLIIPPGAESLDRLYARIGNGVLITGFLGGNADLTTGDFSHGFKGFEIKNGKLGGPVGEMNITGSHTTLWSKLRYTGDDPYVYSRFRMPSLVFEDVSVSGA